MEIGTERAVNEVGRGRFDAPFRLDVCIMKGKTELNVRKVVRSQFETVSAISSFFNIDVNSKS